MGEEKYMIAYQEALNLIKEHTTLNEVVSMRVQESLGKILSSDVSSPESLPPFTNSAMDGFALRSSETEGLNKKNSKVFEVTKMLAAGDDISSFSDSEINSAQCMEIMTGAEVPACFDSVIPIENTEEIKNAQGLTTGIKIGEALEPMQNVRALGSDIKKGSIVLRKGQKITPERLSVLAAIGQTSVEVYRVPKVSILVTGNEIISDSGKSLEPGQIRNSNEPFLVNVLKSMDIDFKTYGVCTDKPELFISKMKEILSEKPDLVLTTGAVSMGKFDFIKTALRDLGGEVIFHKSRIRPGKPVLFGKIRRKSTADEDFTMFLGLPGNPVSTMVGFRFFAYPLIRVLQGCDLESSSHAVLKNNYQRKKPGLRFFLKAAVSIDREGKVSLEILPDQQSYKLNPFLKTNAWAILQEGKSEFLTGETIDWVPINLSGSSDFNFLINSLNE